ncbi:hypothetical protein WN093_13730 [Gammaproteobacteria bacterium AS21]
MKDYHKGLILILLAVLASTTAFYEEDRRWEMAFINYQPTLRTNEAANDAYNDVEQLQQNILAGLDPTLVAQPTAAGVSVKKSTQKNAIEKTAEYCAIGKIIRSNSHSLYHNDDYMAIKYNNNTFIYLTKRDIYLLKKPLDAQSASLLLESPDGVMQEISQAQQSDQCKKNDLYLARVRLSKK